MSIQFISMSVDLCASDLVLFPQWTRRWLLNLAMTLSDLVTALLVVMTLSFNSCILEKKSVQSRGVGASVSWLGAPRVVHCNSAVLR